jgi:hypothetical protein
VFIRNCNFRIWIYFTTLPIKVYFLCLELLKKLGMAKAATRYESYINMAN